MYSNRSFVCSFFPILLLSFNQAISILSAEPDTFIPNNFLQWDELEVAKQLTLIEFEIFSKIQAIELMDLAWSKPKLKYKSPNVIDLINRANKVLQLPLTN